VETLFDPQSVAQSGSLAVLAGVLFYGLRVALPAMLHSMENMQTQIEANTRVLAKLTAAIFMHDATVRGVNPDTLGSTDDIVEKVLDL